MHESIDFRSLAQALLNRAEYFVSSWLPGGRRDGHEWACADLAGGRGKSCRVNLNTGAWADFSNEDDRGRDLISLYAAIEGKTQADAALELYDELGWPRPGRDKAQAPAVRAPRAVPEPQPEDKTEAKRTTWQAIVPVPPQTPECTLVHWQRGKPEMSWRYECDGVFYGHVGRYRTSEGDKDIIPWTWCIDTGDDRGLCKWHNKQWDLPRPLYVPSRTLADSAKHVLIVEGEKCADAAQALLPEWAVVSWPGGGKAWDKADWSWIKGRQVTLWPDCDAKREKLTKAERDAGVDQETKPILPEAQQPGFQTMQRIADHLQELDCKVMVCPIPTPGNVPDGWDVADAIEKGWTEVEVKAFLAAAREHKAQPVDQPLPSAGAGRGAGAKGWRAHLVLTDKGGRKACRENVVLALDGVPSKGVPGIAEVAGVIAFNDFTNSVIKLKAAPWGTPAGEWLEEDELEMGDWLVREHGLPSMPRTALEESVKMVAGRHRYHPVREYLNTLRGRWDGEQRLKMWLRKACHAKADEVPGTDRYLARVGSWVLMAMCARVMDPGCKFDYMVIFEGKQGWGKSTLARALGGEWFADTGLVLGEKDAYQNLQGVWVYEIGELDSFSKAEVTKVKQFASSQKDRFRASFDRRPRDYPRQVIFVGTTNEDHYLTDLTGNRRFWPVRVGGPVDIQWLRENRDQLFAEALHAYEAGHRFHPNADEQRELFDPQQEDRTVETPIETRIVNFLYDEHQVVPHGQSNGAFIDEITTSELLTRIGIGIEKQVTAPNLVKTANAVLKKQGWVLGKSSGKGGAKRHNVYRRPTAHVQSQQQERATDEVAA